ncbi:MAG: hypothetical protein CMA72_09440 [Euryarchaeota archaeon]|nr:hypothetical protein [Euryarchaeota archaeon]|tara:strand:+ start:7887 stop:9674 length:1788 start_codon:yes stop_codon:yes gene_type:complete
MSEKFFIQDRAQLLAVCDFKPFGNKIDDTPSDSETILKLRATLRQLSEISVSENLESYRSQGSALSADFNGVQPYVVIKEAAESVFGPSLDGNSGKIRQDIDDLNELNQTIEKAILSMDFNKSSGFNGDLKNNVLVRVDDLVQENPQPYFNDIKFSVSDYLTNLRNQVLEDAGFTDGEKSQFSSTKVFHHLIDLAAQLMNSPRPKVLEGSVPGVGVRRADSDAFTFRPTIDYDLINPLLAEKPPFAVRNVATSLWNDIKSSESGKLGSGSSALTGEQAFDDEYTMSQHFVAMARELSTSVVAGKYETELNDQSSASSVALRARFSNLLDPAGATLSLNRQVTNPKTLNADATFPVLPMIVVGSSGPIKSDPGPRVVSPVPGSDLFFPDRFLSVRIIDGEFPEHETRPESVVADQAQASIFEQLDVNGPAPIGNVEGTRNYLIQALVQSEAPSIRSESSGNLSNRANRLTSVEDAFQSAVEDYITYISQCASIAGLGSENNLDPVRVSKMLFCQPKLRELLLTMGGLAITTGFDTGNTDDDNTGGGANDETPSLEIPSGDPFNPDGDSEIATTTTGNASTLLSSNTTLLTSFIPEL